MAGVGKSVSLSPGLAGATWLVPPRVEPTSSLSTHSNELGPWQVQWDF